MWADAAPEHAQAAKDDQQQQSQQQQQQPSQQQGEESAEGQQVGTSARHAPSCVPPSPYPSYLCVHIGRGEAVAAGAGAGLLSALVSAHRPNTRTCGSVRVCTCLPTFCSHGRAPETISASEFKARKRMAVSQSPTKRAVNRVCVCVYVCVCSSSRSCTVPRSPSCRGTSRAPRRCVHLCAHQSQGKGQVT